MDTQKEKSVIVVDGSLPVGTIANASAILGITLGMKLPRIVGSDVTDMQGNIHPGIIKFPLPVLKADSQTLKKFRKRLFETDNSDLFAVGFSSLAQSCAAYDEYIEKMQQTAGDSIVYTAIAIFGSRKKVNSLTGSLPLLR